MVKELHSPYTDQPFALLCRNPSLDTNSSDCSFELNVQYCLQAYNQTGSGSSSGATGTADPIRVRIPFSFWPGGGVLFLCLDSSDRTCALIARSMLTI